MGYFLLPTSTTGGNCSKCPNITNCVQCSQSDTYSCAICNSSFFPNSHGGCSPCSSDCLECWDNSTCTTCKPGWLIVQALYGEGKCLRCESPCATCYGVPTYCLTCLSGYTKQGWMCKDVANLPFSFTLSASSAAVLQDIQNITDFIFQALGFSHNDTSIITFESVSYKNGGTEVNGSISPIEGSVQAAEDSLLSGLSQGILSYSVTALQIGSSTTNTTTSTNSTTNTTTNSNTTHTNTNFNYSFYFNKTPSVLYSVTQSPKDYSLITSRRMENLELHWPSSGSDTVLSLNVYDSSRYYNHSTWNLTINGSYYHRVSSNKTLSCSMLYNSNSGNVTFIRSNSSGSMQQVASLKPNTFMFDFNPSSSSIFRSVQLAENCELIKYKPQNSTVFEFFRPMDNWTHLIATPPPPGNYQAGSVDLLYTVASNRLFHFNSSDFQEIFSFPTNQRYEVFSEGGRVVVAAANSSVNVTSSPTANSTNYTIYVIEKKSGGGFALIGNFSLKNVKETQNDRMNMFVSPNLTKVLLLHQKGDGSPRVLVKHVNFNKTSITDLHFNRSAEFVQTIQGFNRSL